MMQKKRMLWVKAARVNADMSQQEAGNLIGKSYNFIWRMENGQARPTQWEKERLAMGYGWPIEEIQF